MTVDKIFELLDRATGYESMTLEQKEKTLNNIEKGWEGLPDNKYTLSESAMVAIFMLDEYLIMGKPELAKKWGDILINDKDRPDCGEKELIKGKILFESGQIDDAKEFFKIAFQKSKGRIFAGEPKKYVDVLKK
jgi:tetratricopeptide (TPR) repeat protein